MGNEKGKLVLLGDVSGKSKHVSPKQALTEQLKSIEIGEFNPNQCFLIFLEEAEGGREITYDTAGLDSAEMVAILESAKHRIIRQHY